MNEWPTRVRTGRAAVLADDLGHRLRADQVVHDRLARVLLEDALRDDRGRRRAAHGLTEVVDEEHAVGVAVEREADVGAAVEHRALQVLEVLDLDRVGRVVRERAVELAEEHGERERQALEHLRHDEATHAVRGVGDDLRAAAARRRSTNDRTWSANSSSRSSVLDLARHLTPVGDAGRDHLLDLREPGLLADRRGAGPAQLDAVVLRRVVARGEHRAGRVERPDAK